MNPDLVHLVFVVSLSRTFLRNNPYFTFVWLFMLYARRRLNRLSSRQLWIQAASTKNYGTFVKSLVGPHSEYIDYERCALGKLETTPSAWCTVCSKITHRKYKLQLLPYDDSEDDKIIVSESMKFNLENALGHPLHESSFFVIPGVEENVPFAAEARVSLLRAPHECQNEMIDNLLETFFRIPRSLRVKDLFAIDPKEYAPEYFYTLAGPNLSKVYFRVNYLGVNNGAACESTGDVCYIVKGETKLVQEGDRHSYLPREFEETVDVEFCHSPSEIISQCGITNVPPCLTRSMEALQVCLSPFLQKDIRMKISPVFLVKGAPGSGKFKLIHSAARRNGLNLVNVDFGMIQSLSTPQTEAKLRNVFQNATSSVPCILRLSNIQIFGKNGEGQKDERIVEAFASVLKKLDQGKPEHPLIVIATLENDELDADVERLFIETINVGKLDQTLRSETLSWFLKVKGLQHEADLSQIAGLASNFVMADLNALVMEAATNFCRSSSSKRKPLILSHADFVTACDHIQGRFNDRLDSRIPKVHWEDIGGLANLKHEIKRRIELPLRTGVNLGRSGLLLYGPPGTGKTLLAKAVATECQLHFISVKGPELLNMYVGQSEKNIREVFERAREASPCVIFFDELDSLAPNRGRSGDSGGVMDRVVSQLLSEMDGLESTGTIFVIGATNRPDLIDPALLRPGRFDKMLYVGIYSDRDSQLSVLRAVARRFKMKDSGAELETLIEHLPPNLTGADLYAVCSDAWLMAVRRKILDLEKKRKEETKEKVETEVDEKNCAVVVELQDFLEAAASLVPSVSQEELKRYEKLESELSSGR